MLTSDEAVRLVAEPGERQPEHSPDARHAVGITTIQAIGCAPWVVFDPVKANQVGAGILYVAGEHHLYSARSVGERFDHCVRTANHRVLRACPLHVRVPSFVVLDKDDVPVYSCRVGFSVVHRLFFLSSSQ